MRAAVALMTLSLVLSGCLAEKTPPETVMAWADRAPAFYNSSGEGIVEWWEEGSAFVGAEPVLLKMLAESTDVRQRTRIIHAIGVHKSERSTEALIGVCLNQRDTIESRDLAARYLGTLKAIQAVPVLSEVLSNDPNCTVRRGAAVGLWLIGTDEARTAIDTAAGREADPELKALLVEKLEQWHTRY